jgi:hypothetical protein
MNCSRILATLIVPFATCMSATDAEARSLSEIRTASFGDVGYLRHVRCPISGRYDCLTFPRDLYELNGDCFTLGYSSAVLGGYEEAMLMQFRSGELALMVKTGFGDRFEIIDIERPYECPDLY